MDGEKEYIDINKALWNEKTVHHLKSDFYSLDSFMQGVSTLKEPELGLLGDIKGKSVLHLQCHFGQDSMSLSRMGAIVTGVDFSDKAIDVARKLVVKLDFDTKFICADIYALPDVLDKEYDIVFTSYGVLGWLPDMKRWARIVSRFLKKGGQFILAEFHPVVWMFDYEFTKVQYSYFNKEAIIETVSGTYADRAASIEMLEIGWNHNLSEVFQALLDAGLTIKQFKEYDHSPYNCFKNMVESEPGKFRLKGLEEKFPLLYTLKAVKE